jgi:hypothetical protein
VVQRYVYHEEEGEVKEEKCFPTDGNYPFVDYKIFFKGKDVTFLLSP